MITKLLSALSLSLSLCRPSIFPVPPRNADVDITDESCVSLLSSPACQLSFCVIILMGCDRSVTYQHSEMSNRPEPVREER